MKVYQVTIKESTWEYQDYFDALDKIKRVIELHPAGASLEMVQK